MNRIEPNSLELMDLSKSTPRSGPSRAAENGRPPNLRRLSLVIAVVLVIALLAGLLPRLAWRRVVRNDTRELAVPTVNVVSPVPGKAAGGLTLSSEVKPSMEASIYARASGYLKRWLVDIGARVEAGQLLAEIDTPDLNQELAQRRAELAEAEANLELAKSTAARWVELVKTVSVSQQEAAEKQADLALKAATVDAALANVHRLEQLQSFARVTAPFAGIVTARKTDVGDLINASSGKELFHLAQTGTLRVYVHVPQMAARQVTVGLMADLTLAELPARVFPARVVRTAGAMDTESRTLLTELEVDNAKGEILAGSYAQVRFHELNLDAALTLPSNTLLFRAEGPQVGVVMADGTVELRRVETGRDFGPTMEILGGVGPTDRVIINPADSLVSGAKVRLAGPVGPVERE